MIPLLLALLFARPVLAEPGGRGPEFLDQVVRVYQEESARLAARVAEVGRDRVVAELARDSLDLRIPGLGRAKVVSIAGELAIRVVHQASGIAFVFLDQDRISPESVELRRYLAKQHLDAGSRETKPQTGRDVVFVWMKDQEVAASDSHPRHPGMSADWWRDYRLATLAKPGGGDIALGTACAIVYGGLAICVAGLRHHLNPAAPAHWQPAAFTATWCMVQGVLVKAISNASLRGTPGKQRARAAGQSLAFNYSMSILSQGLMHTLNVFDPAGLLSQLQVWGNVAVNSYISVDWRAPVILRQKAGLNSDPIRIPLPNGKEILMERAATERSFIGVLTFPISIIDVMGISPLPLGKMTLLATVPILRRLTLWYAERIGSPDAETYRARWESWLPVRLWNGVSDALNDTWSQWSTRPDACGRFLVPESVAAATSARR